ncbi:MAG: D-alanine--D-alanine ligase [Clostridia bacterium]|nr:D-alanine--D-alanine ligase [Clostridia bacterium]
MTKLGIFYGGRSGEHEVSLASASAVIKALDKSKYEVVMIGITKQGRWLSYDGPVEGIEDGSWEKEAKPLEVSKIKEMIDFAFPVLHGTYGEDGKIQGIFEMMDIPYAGCGVLSSAINMDKGFTKDLFVKHGIPTCKYVAGTRKTLDVKGLEFPVFVKPANAGSSVGVSKAKDEKELKEALDLAFTYDSRIIVEEGVDAREIETAVIGNDEPLVGEVGEIVIASDFYDYTSKYSEDTKTILNIPADIPEETKAKVRELAKKTYIALDCSGFARVDFFLDRKTGELFVNEINTIPGFTKHSMFPMLWKEKGLGFDELLDRIIEYGYERYNAKDNR